MGETIKRVVPVKVSYTCDECGQGEMLPTGLILTSWPEKIEHKCTNCKTTKYFTTKYPTIRYQEE